MRSLHLWLMLAMVPWLAGAGCPRIYSEQPLGQEIATLDPEKVNGLWLWPGGEIWGVRVLDAQQGTLTVWVAVSESDAKDYRKKNEPLPLLCEPPLEVQKNDFTKLLSGAILRRQARSAGSNDPVHFYFPERREKPGEPYFTDFALLSDGEFFAVAYYSVWAKQEVFDKRLTELVERGALPGRIESSGRVLLGPLLPEHYRFILSQENGLFNWTNPIPLIKLLPGLDPCKKGEKSK